MNDKQICPECKAEISMDEESCSSCGFQLKNDENNLIEVKNQVKTFYNLCISLETIFPDKEKYPLISHVKSTAGNNFRGIFLDDIFKFLCYLGVADGVFDDREISLINYIFETNFTKLQIIQMMDTNLDKYLNSLPLSFMFFYEGALNFKVFVDSDGRPAHDLLLNLYDNLGNIFINIDENVDQGEDNLLSNCISTLSVKLNEFKESEYESTLSSLNLNTK